MFITVAQKFNGCKTLVRDGAGQFTTAFDEIFRTEGIFSHPAVAEVAVIGVPDEKWGETVKALVVLAPGATATEADLIAYSRSKLAHHKRSEERRVGKECA